MNEIDDFENLIKLFVDPQTLSRSKSISDKRIKILQINKEKGIFKAEIQGNELIPYKLDIDINGTSESRFLNIISHNCPDFMARKGINNKFCKHITKIFYLLHNQDAEFAYDLLKRLNVSITNTYLKSEADNSDLDCFINRDIEIKLTFEYKGLNFFLDEISLEKTTREQIIMILRETKKFTASSRGFHGCYKGGLYDHILLTTNYIYQLYKTIVDKGDMRRALLAGICHDFGKIPHYNLRKNLADCKINMTQVELDDIHREIVEKFHYQGRDYHVEGAIAIIKKYVENYTEVLDQEVYKAIIFHHGGWSKYTPKRMSRLATMIHVADMIASHIFQI
jgi:HD superfamily phosphohydrolase YqeK